MPAISSRPGSPAWTPPTRPPSSGAGAANQFALSRFGAQADAANQYAGARNNFALTGYQTDAQRMQAQAQLQAQAAQFGASALNGNSQFNAGQIDGALARQLQAAGLTGQISDSFANNYRADTSLIAQLGEQQRAIAQQQAMAPYAQLQALGGAYQYGGPLVGQTINSNGTSSGTDVTKTTPSTFDQLLAAAQVASSFVKPSDRRAKRGIERVGTLDSGLGLYRYRYLWDADARRPRLGVMADEVARIAPHALGPIEDGFATVDYGKLGLAQLVEA
jgi:hypothetical protein